MEGVEERVRASSECSTDQRISPHRAHSTKQKSAKLIRIKSTPKPPFNSDSIESLSTELNTLTVTDDHSPCHAFVNQVIRQPPATDKPTFTCRFCSKEFLSLKHVRRHEIVFCTKDWTTAFKDH